MSSDRHRDEPQRFRLSGAAAWAGVKALLPMTLPVPFFGLAFGALVTEADKVSNLAGWASSWLIFGGASQVAGVTVLQDGGGVLVAVATMLIINSRHLMYSAALQPGLSAAPRWFRFVGPFFLVDQVFATLDDRTEDSLNDRMNMMLGAGVVWLVLWSGFVALGILVGGAVPDSWQLGFTVPLLFLGLLINSIKERPGLAAAVVSAVVAVAAGQVGAAGVGLLVAAIAGMAVAATLDLAGERREERREEPREERGEEHGEDGEGVR